MTKRKEVKISLKRLQYLKESNLKTKRLEKKSKQAGAELCQAQVKLGYTILFGIKFHKLYIKLSKF